eukprot:gene14562-17211_t
MPYVKNYNNAFKIYSSLVDEESFAELIEVFGYLPSYLISPIQQTPRYVLLFSDLLKNTNPQNQDYANLTTLIEMVRATATKINECITSSTENDDEIYESPKRPASASSKRRPRNSLSMHKKAIDAVLSSPTPSGNDQQDYSHIPSYLRPTAASSGWSRSKVEAPSTPQWRFSSNASSELPYTPSSSTGSTMYIPPSSPLFIDRSPMKNQPQWRPSSPAPKSFTYPKEIYTRSTKTLANRPVSPPPKPNFYSSSTDTGSSSSNTSTPTALSHPNSPLIPVFKAPLAKTSKTSSTGSLLSHASSSSGTTSPRSTENNRISSSSSKLDISPPVSPTSNAKSSSSSGSTTSMTVEISSLSSLSSSSLSSFGTF